MCDQQEKEPEKKCCPPPCPKYTFGAKVYRLYRDIKVQFINVLDTIDTKDGMIKAGAVAASPFVGMALVRKQRIKAARLAGPLITTMATSYGCFPEETGNFLTSAGVATREIYLKVAANQRRLLEGFENYKKREEPKEEWCPQSGFLSKVDEIGVDTHRQFDELLSNREFAVEMAKVGFPRIHLDEDHIWADDDHDAEIVELMDRLDRKPKDKVDCEVDYIKNDDIELKLFTNFSRYSSFDISDDIDDEEEYYIDEQE